MKNVFFSFILFFAFPFSEMSCANQKKQIQNTQPIIFYSKEKCRGFCPAFTMAFSEPNQLKYNGIANVAVLGEKMIALEKTDFQNLKKAFEKSKFQGLEKEYLSEVMDIPKVILKYNGQQVIYHERDAPDDLIVLAKLVEEFLPEK